MAPVPILAGHRESMLVMTHADVRSPVQYAKLPAGGGDIAGWSLREASARNPRALAFSTASARLSAPGT